MREYIALTSKDIGKFGCFWITNDMLDLLDTIFMVRTVRIYQPNDSVPFIQSSQFTVDEVDTVFTDTSFDYIFDMENNIISYWEFNSFFLYWHYEAVLLKHNKNIPCSLSSHHYTMYCIR